MYEVSTVMISIQFYIHTYIHIFRSVWKLGMINVTYLGMNVYNYINTELMNVLIAFTYIHSTMEF